ncbi:MAG: DUF1800 domain-containing protein [Actinomycetia bacterium]|nr:DUF1800 domain-containing protein [Actinomycetes bacterium]
MGFGATGRMVDAVVAQDPSDYVASALAADPDDDPGAWATPMPALTPPAPPGDEAGEATRNTYNRALATQRRTLSAWWISRMATVDQPVHEKLTLLWHNHFATSAHKVRIPALMAAQNQKIRRHNLGDFRTLAYSMLTDAAMLRWLDGQRNTAGGVNENLAREFMELFTLGRDNGYTEADVREGARALAGWEITPEGHTRVVPRRRDKGSKTVLGVSGDLDAASFCDAVLARPESATFVAQRLWQHLVSDTPASDATLGRSVAAYGAERDLRALTTAILTDPEFGGLQNTYVNTPAEWLIGLVRSLQIPLDTQKQTTMADQTLTVLGQQPFYPPSVGGWPRGQAWLSTGSALTRLRAATTLATSADLSTIENAATSDRIDAAGYLLGIGAWTDRSAAALRPLVDRPPTLVAAAANTPENLTS